MDREKESRSNLVGMYGEGVASSPWHTNPLLFAMTWFFIWHRTSSTGVLRTELPNFIM